MGGNRKRSSLLLAALLVAVAAAGALWLYRDYRRFVEQPLAPLAVATTIDVPFGTSLPGVLRILEQHGIRAGNSWYWRALARELGTARRLHAGEYALTPGLTPTALLQKMAAGTVVQHRFTIVEGWTFRQLRLALAQDSGLRHTLAAADDKDIMRRLGQPGALPEGWFLPETYSYVKGMSDFDILQRANESMHRLLDALWARHPDDFVLDSRRTRLLILASIVEKETARADERAADRRVFLHRLRIGMRLQTDPTVIYGLGASYDGNLRRRDLDTDTPYNTYTRAGLPPTPIALPGKAALQAAMHPAATDALYFVARGDGSHEFSATLEEAQSGRRNNTSCTGASDDGKLITLEGGEGAGKSTVLDALRELLGRTRHRGRRHARARRHRGRRSDTCRAARSGDARDVRGNRIAADVRRARATGARSRSAGAAPRLLGVVRPLHRRQLAYQGGGRGQPGDRIAELERWAAAGAVPI